MKQFSAIAAGLVFATSPALAQSINVDFGASTAPTSGYAGVGSGGTWNLVGVLPPAQRAALVDLQGAPSAANIYMIGGTALLDTNDPATAGDDQALLDDMLIGFNDPVDVCVWIENLVNGDYEVILYAMTPSNPALDCRTRVDFATPGPTEVGGAWPGTHVEKVTYAAFTVTVTDGTIGVHSGLWAAQVQSGLNGMQLIDLSTVSVGEVRDAPGGPALRAFPNPAHGGQAVALEIGRPGATLLEIFDVAGRLVWRRSLPGSVAGSQHVLWDGKDGHGRLVPAAVYFARVRDAGGSGDSIKLVRVD